MNPFSVDYTDLDQVKAFTKKAAMKWKCTLPVIRVPGRNNYNISAEVREEDCAHTVCIFGPDGSEYTLAQYRDALAAKELLGM